MPCTDKVSQNDFYLIQKYIILLIFFLIWQLPREKKSFEKNKKKLIKSLK